MVKKKRKRRLTRRKFIKSAAVAAVSTSAMKAIGEMRFEEYDLIASITRESFYEFVKEFWHEAEPRPFINNWHIKYICDEFQRAAERVFKGLDKDYDLIINISPGETKSLTYSVMSLPWIWTRMPTAKFIGGSHNHDLSLDLSRKSRGVVKSEKYRKAFPSIRLSQDQDAKGYFVNTTGGSRRSCSVDSKVTGFHGDFFAVDDPIDPREVMSDVIIKTANDWMSDVVFQRRTTQSSSLTILIMQRLHENDPTAFMMNRAKEVQRLAIQNGEADALYRIKHICIPAEVTDRVKPKTLKKFYRNGLMDPIKLPRSVLNEKGVDPFMYAGQYLQQPSPRGGGMFKVEKIQRIKIGEAPKKWLRRVRFWDKTATLGGKGAFTVGLLMGEDRDHFFWILDVDRFRLDSSARERRMKDTAENIDGRDIHIGIEQEPGSGGKESAENTVRNLAGYIVRIDKPSGSDSSKEQRADPFSVQVNNGNVRMVIAEWNREYINELKHFPASTYKDQVDASSGAFNQLNKKRKIVGGVFGRRN